MANKWEGYSACDLIRWSVSKGRDPVDVLSKIGLNVSEATIKVQSAAARRGKDIPSLSEGLESRLLDGTKALAYSANRRPLLRQKIDVASGQGFIIIANGNTGVPAAALYAAEEAGFKTMGTMQRGFHRDGKENGPDIAQRFGLVECKGRGATGFDAVMLNLSIADAVVRVASKQAQFREEIPPVECLKNQPLFDINWASLRDRSIAPKLGIWLRPYRRVAIFGNTEPFDPGIFKWARKYFREAFAYRERSQFIQGDRRG